MTTQHTPDEQRDADVSVAEQSHTSDLGASSPSIETAYALDAAPSLTSDIVTSSLTNEAEEASPSAALPTPVSIGNEEQANEFHAPSATMDEALSSTTQEVLSLENYVESASLVSVPTSSEAILQETTVAGAATPQTEPAEDPLTVTVSSEVPATTEESAPQAISDTTYNQETFSVSTAEAQTSSTAEAPEVMHAQEIIEAHDHDLVVEQAHIPPTEAEAEITTLSTEPETATLATPAVDEQPESPALPFTAFIEEFRQSEAQRSVNTLPLFDAEPVSEPFILPTATPILAAAEPATAQQHERDVAVSAIEPSAQHTPSLVEATTSFVGDPQERMASDTSAPEAPLTLPNTPAVRPVSPLLRPATRLRVPRHALIRSREHSEETAQHIPSAKPAVPEQATDPLAAPETPRPARRYRFDRPAASATTTTPPVASPLPASVRSEEPKVVQAVSPTPSIATPARTDNTLPVASAETQPKVPAGTNGHNGNGTTSAKAVSAPPVVQEQATNGIPAISEQDRRRRHGQDRPREKDQPAQQAQASLIPVAPAASTATTPPAAIPVQETILPVAEQIPTMMIEDIAPEDLPPLEYAELQKASSRRRRRHRTSNTAPIPTAVTPIAAKAEVVATPTPFIQAAPPVVPVVIPPVPAASNKVAPALPTPALPTPALPTPALPSSALPTPALSAQYTIVSGYTVNQMNQGNDASGPFMAPEPSPARGSVLSRDGRTVNRAESQRTPVYTPRSTDPSPSSIQQLASVLSQAIQTQTDRMVAELHRSNQAPTNVSVSFPPFPSTERVGVFVDVANLLYSARTLRIAVDFGKLLDFLRGNRRLVRAHAYCPTSPQAGDEQMFLQAVKGLGYRITTKNYKTFASGAKKADLDLDLCMDVVRLVEGKAVDCVVLVSGDSDFMPMLDYCSDHGVRVEVAAFDEAMSATLRQSCDLFVNLSMLEEIRA